MRIVSLSGTELHAGSELGEVSVLQVSDMTMELSLEQASYVSGACALDIPPSCPSNMMLPCAVDFSSCQGYMGFPPGGGSCYWFFPGS